MKNNVSIPILAFAAATLAAPVASAQTHASILFTRTNHRAVDNSTDTILYRVKPSGDNVVQLTPMTFHVDYGAGRWSPGGGSIVYERAEQSPGTDWQLFVVNRQGGSPRQITTGPGKHTQAAWGPNATIAYITNETGKNCLGAVRADGTQQRIVFCPSREPYHRGYNGMSTPQWTPGGKSVFVEVGDYGPGLDPEWFSRIFRVNVTTGAVTKLTEQMFGDPQYVTISSDGTHAVYADDEGDIVPMRRVDLATGSSTTLTTGTMPRFSKDGRKIAFIRDEHVWLMRADGTNVREAIADPGPNARYRFADWSSDGKRILVDKIANDRFLQIVYLPSGSARTVTKGTAEAGAWFQP